MSPRSFVSPDAATFFPFIAGAIKIFAFEFNANAMHVNASSAKPFAIFAITFAVAGAIKNKSASSAS